MQDSVETIIRETSEQLRKHLNPEAIWLFGSHARGDAGPDSDLDFLVVVAESAEPRYRRAQRAHGLLSQVAMPKDVIVMKRAEWDRERRVKVSLASTVLGEGRKLYGS
jgi:predicted nucleotidyltransferase